MAGGSGGRACAAAEDDHQDPWFNMSLRELLLPAHLAMVQQADNNFINDLGHNSMPPAAFSSNSNSSSPAHMLLSIPNFSSLRLDRSSSSSTNLTPPVITQMDHTNGAGGDPLFGDTGAMQELHVHQQHAGMAAGEHVAATAFGYSSVTAHNNAGAAMPAMLQVLGALNGAAEDPAGAHCAGPATLNFFETLGAAPPHSAHVASLETFGHNLLLPVQAGGPVDEHQTDREFLSLLNREFNSGLHDHSSTNITFTPGTPFMNAVAATASTSCSPNYMQLQPLENYLPVQTPPHNLFQRRSAGSQHPRHGTVVPGVPLPSLMSPLMSKATPSSSSSSKPKLAGSIVPSPLSTGSPSNSMVSANAMEPRDHYTINKGGWFAGKFVGSMTQRSAVTLMADERPEDHDYLDEDGNSQRDLRMPELADEGTFFHDMSGPDLEITEGVSGPAPLMQEGSVAGENHNKLHQSGMGASEALRQEGANTQQLATNDSSNRGGGGGRGAKVKGPPAKNLMAERRRRKKLNDRLYTLRSVVPKISKMDRASILGDAIDYLKELLQRINDLHNELEASPVQQGTPTPGPSGLLISTPSASLVKLEDCAGTSLECDAGLEQAGQSPKIEVRTREGRALNIHMFCARRPGLLLATMRALDGLGLDVQQAVISCFNGFALDIFRAEQSQEEEVAAEEIKRVLLQLVSTASTTASCSTAATMSAVL